MRIYLDNCCLMRDFDNQSQPRIRMETLAVAAVLERIRLNRWSWVAGDTLRREMLACPIADRRERGLLTLEYANKFVRFTPPIAALTDKFVKYGIRWMDAAHFASAEYAECDLFLTTDDDLLRRLRGLPYALRVRPLNPVEAVLEGNVP